MSDNASADAQIIKQIGCLLSQFLCVPCGTPEWIQGLEDLLHEVHPLMENHILYLAIHDLQDDYLGSKLAEEEIRFEMNGWLMFKSSSLISAPEFNCESNQRPFQMQPMTLNGGADELMTKSVHRFKSSLEAMPTLRLVLLMVKVFGEHVGQKSLSQWSRPDPTYGTRLLEMNIRHQSLGCLTWDWTIASSGIIFGLVKDWLEGHYRSNSNVQVTIHSCVSYVDINLDETLCLLINVLINDEIPESLEGVTAFDEWLLDIFRIGVNIVSLALTAFQCTVM
ncbi:hypothetical protein C8J56DRAFT_894344 [Mycena floridula]|nr:hypothetical protein C8J56DRAFT_894344 [Mycena floridula]